MIIVLRPNSTQQQLDHILDHIQEMGLKAHLSRGEHRTIIGVIGDESKLQADPLSAIAGVEQVLPILKPFKLASREFRKEDTIVEVGSGQQRSADRRRLPGDDRRPVRHRKLRSARHDCRPCQGGRSEHPSRRQRFKPRTSPYSFQGLGEAGLKILRDVGAKHGMPVVTEIMDPRQIDAGRSHADMFQIAPATCRISTCSRKLVKRDKPVLLKRSMSATVKDMLMSAEYILSEGNPQVVLCERGVRSFEDSTRNMLDLSAMPNVKGQSHLPIIADPSHATGRPDLIPAMARATIAAGADGVHVEVHSCPEKAIIGWATGAAAESIC